MNYTPNYNLNQWEAGDRVQRTDFNADNAKIDAALKAEADIRAEAVDSLTASLAQKADSSAVVVKAEIVTGTYKGDGKESKFIDLGFTPQAVFVIKEDGAILSSSASNRYGGLALLGYPVKCSSVSVLSITENGFMVHYITDSSNIVCSNHSNMTYYYLALK